MDVIKTYLNSIKEKEEAKVETKEELKKVFKALNRAIIEADLDFVDYFYLLNIDDYAYGVEATGNKGVAIIEYDDSDNGSEITNNYQKMSYDKFIDLLEIYELEKAYYGLLDALRDRVFENQETTKALKEFALKLKKLED